MKKHIIINFITQTLLLSCIIAQDWKFKSREEDWGETLYATHKNAEGCTITIFTSKKEFKPSLLLYPYKVEYGDTFSVEISIDKSQTYRLKGSISDYFGEIEVEGIQQEMLQEMMAGKLVSISIAKKENISFSLAGATKAISQLSVVLQKIENTENKRKGLK
jgi:hypothetical protein